MRRWVGYAGGALNGERSARTNRRAWKSYDELRKFVRWQFRRTAIALGILEAA
jgi:hypothetical protein